MSRGRRAAGLPLLRQFARGVSLLLLRAQGGLVSSLARLCLDLAASRVRRQALPAAAVRRSAADCGVLRATSAAVRDSCLL